MERLLIGEIEVDLTMYWTGGATGDTLMIENIRVFTELGIDDHQ